MVGFSDSNATTSNDTVAPSPSPEIPLSTGEVFERWINGYNVTVNGTEVTIPLTQYNPNAGIFTPDYSAIVKGLILKMANGEEIKLGVF